MENLNEKQKRKLLKLAKLVDEGDLAIAEHLFELEEKMDEEIPQIKEVISRVKGDKGDSPSEKELIALIKPLIPTVEDGKDYVLTKKDKQDIADSIKVPIVEKVIEKTEIVKEQPIIKETIKVTNEIKEVAVTDKPDEIVSKINTAEKQIKLERIEMTHVYNRMIDIERIAKANANSLPITTTFVNGTRAKNLIFTGATISYANDTATIAITSGTTVTASNGLTLVGSDIRLGGTLTGNTTVLGASNYSLGLSGFTTFAASAVTTNISASTILSLLASTELRLMTPFIQTSSASVGWVFTLKNATTGEGEWNAPAASGVGTIGTIDSQTASTNGAVISGTSLYMQSASLTRPGLVNTTTQNFSGAKLFNAETSFNGGYKVLDGMLGKFYNSGTANYTSLQAGPGAYSGDVELKLPSAYPASNGYALVATTAGVMSWAAMSSGLTVGTTAIASGTTTRILYDNAGVLGEYIVGGGLLASGGTLSASTSVTAGSFGITINGQGGVITTGQKGGFIPVPFAGTITGWILTSTDGTTGAALSGSIVIDCWADSYANFPPTVADTIFGTKPALSSQSKNTATGLSIPVTAQSLLGFNVDSASTCVFVTLTLFITKS